jgi:hypothetical protein
LLSIKNSNSLTIIISLSLILLLASILPSCATHGIISATGQEVSQAHPQGNAAQSIDKVTYKTIPIRMEMEAGAAQYREWPGGERTIHAGIGWLHPFGRGEYVAGMGYPEAKDYPMPSYFNEEWMNIYGTRLFCIYMLKDGNIYAYDGVVGNLEPYDEEVDDGKMDYLINVIVGGTGAYEGATGMLLGRTPGKGKNTKISDGISLPVSILKLMDGYIKIPLK